MEVLDTTRRLTSLNSVHVCIPITKRAFRAMCEVDHGEPQQSPTTKLNLTKIKDELADASFACLREPHLGKRSPVGEVVVDL